MTWGGGAPWVPPLQRIAIPEVSLQAGEQLKDHECLAIVFCLSVLTQGRLWCSP